MEKGIQVGNESLSKDTLLTLIEAIKDILHCRDSEEETKRKALEILGKFSVVQNINISDCEITERR